MEATSQYLTSMATTSASTLESDTDYESVHAAKATKPRPQSKQTPSLTNSLLLLWQTHKPRACPAWRKKCSYCDKLNHTVEVCKKAEKDRQLDIQHNKKETAKQSNAHRVRSYGRTRRREGSLRIHNRQ